MQKTKAKELKVVFDTNSIHNDTSHNLLRNEIYTLIKEHSDLSDISISWHLPEVVLHERKYQMIKAGQSLLPHIQKVEKLLGHNLAINDSTIRTTIEQNLDRQISELDIKILPFNPDEIDWKQMMLSSTYRNLPFSKDGEKGFRDALISEIFFQLIRESPKSPSQCSIVFLSADGLLIEHLEIHLLKLKNVRILKGIDELKTLINTLASEVSEEYVATIQKNAETYFFQEDIKSSFFNKANIRSRITELFGSEPFSIPEGTSKTEIRKVRISPPSFEKKERQRIFWNSRIVYEITAYRYERKPLSKDYAQYTLDDEAATNIANYWAAKQQPDPKALLEAWAANIKKTKNIPDDAIKSYLWLKASFTGDDTIEPVKSGIAVYDVIWSVQVSSQRLTLSKGNIEDIKYVETVWM